MRSVRFRVAVDSTDRENRPERIATEIGNGETLVAPTVADEAEVTAMVADTREIFASIDILVNNAGLLRPDPVADADRADFRRQVQVTLLGVAWTTFIGTAVNSAEVITFNTDMLG